MTTIFQTSQNGHYKGQIDIPTFQNDPRTLQNHARHLKNPQNPQKPLLTDFEVGFQKRPNGFKNDRS